jgi:hypothetical protein
MHRADHAVMLDNESGRIHGSKAGWASIGTFEAITVKPHGLFPTGVGIPQQLIKPGRAAPSTRRPLRHLYPGAQRTDSRRPARLRGLHEQAINNLGERSSIGLFMRRS